MGDVISAELVHALRVRAHESRPHTCGNMKLASEIIFCGRRLVVRGFDPMSVHQPRVYLEDPKTGELVVEFLSILRPSRLPLRTRTSTISK